MSPINFDILSADHPDLVPAWEALERWFNDHPRRTLFEVESLKPVLGGHIGESDLVAALWWMVKAGMLARVFKFRGPSGELLPGDYPSLDRIPKTVEDRYGRHSFPTDDLTLVPCYRREASHASP